MTAKIMDPQSEDIIRPWWDDETAQPRNVEEWQHATAAKTGERAWFREWTEPGSNRNYAVLIYEDPNGLIMGYEFVEGGAAIRSILVGRDLWKSVSGLLSQPN